MIVPKSLYIQITLFYKMGLETVVIDNKDGNNWKQALFVVDADDLKRIKDSCIAHKKNVGIALHQRVSYRSRRVNILVGVIAYSTPNVDAGMLRVLQHFLSKVGERNSGRKDYISLFHTFEYVSKKEERRFAAERVRSLKDKIKNTDDLITLAGYLFMAKETNVFFTNGRDGRISSVPLLVEEYYGYPGIIANERRIYLNRIMEEERYPTLKKLFVP